MQAALPKDAVERLPAATPLETLLSFSVPAVMDASPLGPDMTTSSPLGQALADSHPLDAPDGHRHACQDASPLDSDSLAKPAPEACHVHPPGAHHRTGGGTGGSGGLDGRTGASGQVLDDGTRWRLALQQSHHEWADSCFAGAYRLTGVQCVTHRQRVVL